MRNTLYLKVYQVKCSKHAYENFIIAKLFIDKNDKKKKIVFMLT